MNKITTTLVTAMALLGFVQLVDLVAEQPQFGIPLTTVLVAIWLYAALLGYKEKR
jgi:hypothetical protein